MGRSPEFLPGTISEPPVTDPGEFLELVAKNPHYGNHTTAEGRQKIEREIDVLNGVLANCGTRARGRGFAEIHHDVVNGTLRTKNILQALLVIADFSKAR